MKKNKNLLVLIISLFAFIMLVGGVSYSYFIYSNDVVTADLSSGNISINFTSSNNSLVLSNILPMADNLGKMQEDYLDFTVVGVADIEQIKYEVQIIPNDDNTLNGDHIQLYLTDQSDNEIVEPINYNNLSIATKNNGKIIYSDKISGNSDGTSKTTTRDFRLRIWVDDSYTETEAKTFGFSIYLYAENF